MFFLKAVLTLFFPFKDFSSGWFWCFSLPFQRLLLRVVLTPLKTFSQGGRPFFPFLFPPLRGFYPHGGAWADIRWSTSKLKLWLMLFWDLETKSAIKVLLRLETIFRPLPPSFSESVRPPFLPPAYFGITKVALSKQSIEMIKSIND